MSRGYQQDANGEWVIFDDDFPKMNHLCKGAKVRTRDGKIRWKRKRKDRIIGVIIGETRACWHVKWDGIDNPELLPKNSVVSADR